MLVAKWLNKLVGMLKILGSVLNIMAVQDFIFSCMPVCQVHAKYIPVLTQYIRVKVFNSMYKEVCTQLSPVLHQYILC
jgi:hypothetical protein